MLLYFLDSIVFKNSLFIYLHLETGEGKEKRKERNINVQEKHRSVASHTSPVGDLACDPGMCPNWKSNWRPFGSQASAQSTEPYQPGLLLILI